MLWNSAMRSVVVGLAGAGLIALSACAPIPTVVDTPKDGDRIALSVDQPMQVRWSNQSPDHGAWELEKGPPTSAVTLVSRSAERPEGAAFALDVFDFKAAKPGAERLTFVYRHKDGRAPTPEERITIEVGVG